MNFISDDPGVTSDLTLSRSSSGHERLEVRGQSSSPSPGPQPRVSSGSQHRLCPDSGIASIEDTRSPSTDLGTCLTSDKCNGRLQRTEKVDEADPPLTSMRLSETEEEEEPLMASAASLVVPGLQPTQNRCHVQTSGWL